MLQFSSNDDPGFCYQRGFHSASGGAEGIIIALDERRDLCVIVSEIKRSEKIVRSFVLLTRNNGSELKTGQGGAEIISNYAWGFSMT